MHNIVELLNNQELTLDSLTNDLGIKIKSYDMDAGHKFHVLNYNQIESPKNHPIADQCRGLILLEDEGRFSVACRPFNRFYNIGECPETQEHIDWDASTVMEKLDGSLIKIWFDHIGKRWEIATRGTAFGESQTMLGKEYRELAIEAMKEIDSEAMFQTVANTIFNTHHTYLFELVGPENRIVTPYKKNELVFLAMVLNGYGTVEPAHNRLHTIENFIGRVAKSFKLNSPSDIIEASKNINDLEEGFVVYDQFNVPVCKVKSPMYVAVHHIRGEGLSRKRIIDLVLTNEIDEYLTYYPEDKKVIDPYVQSYNRLFIDIGETWSEINPLVTEGMDRKEIAMRVKDLPYSMLIFKAIDKDVHPVDIWNELDHNGQHRLVDKFLGVWK